ncbi:MAG: class A beta-lactamase-related serine hydrolase [Patescibacteria group bacterium]|nr:class A beta-lactamase-related serine hydrolase [Patescibacteria group bacterium]
MDNNYIVGLKLKPQRQKKKVWAWILLLILVAIGISGVFKRSPELISPLSRINNSLRNIVDESLTGARGTYGIAIKNLKSGESYYFNEHRVFETGSLYKLWIMATVFKQIQDGGLTEDQVLSEDIAALNEKFNIDPDSAELKEGTVTLTVHDALLQMIAISHNYAALLLTEKVKLSSVAAFLKENGFSESSVGTDGDPPKSTPADIALFYERLYKGELANQQYTQEMADLLKNQQSDDGLPKYLPDEVPVANKTGDIGWFKHDAGIIYTGNGDYIITIMSESDYPPGAQERIAMISKEVYEYFTKK